MEWIKQVQTKGSVIYIPIINTNESGRFRWEDEENVDDFLERYSNSGPICYGRFVVWSEEEEKVVDLHNEWGTFQAVVYDVRDESGDKYYLLTLGDLEDPEQIYHSVLLPYNKFNMMKFLKDYMLPFGGGKFSWG